MNVKTILVSGLAIATVGATSQSCLAVATSSIGLGIIKKVLLGGISKGTSIFSNKQAFLENDLIEKAIPQNLQGIYSTLNKLSPSLITKSKDYVAQAAAYTVNISEPILKNAVNNLTAEDVTRIANGDKGEATKVLKEKTAQQIMLAIQPKVDEKLNEFGIVKTLNTALQGTNFIGNLLGNKTNSTNNASTLSKLASEQLVNGLFNIIEDYEKQNSILVLDALQKK